MADYEQIMIIRAGALGDTLMVLPSICDLPEHCRVVFAGREPGLYFVSLKADAVSDMESSGWHRLFADGPVTSHPAGLRVSHQGSLERGPFDPRTVAAFLKDPDGRLKQRLSVLFPRAEVRLFPPLPKEDGALHASMHIALCLKDAGIQIEPLRALERAGRTSLIPGYSREEARDMLLLHPGSGSRTKNYPPSFWVELLREAARGGICRDSRPKVLLGPAELDKEGEFRESEERGLCTVAVVLERRQLHRVLSSARLFVGHDSGVSHLAAMMGLFTIALFRKSNPAVWHPIGPHVKVFTEAGGSEVLLSEILAVLSCHSEVTRL